MPQRVWSSLGPGPGWWCCWCWWRQVPLCTMWLSQRRWQMLLDALVSKSFPCQLSISFSLSEVFFLPSPPAAVWVVKISTDRRRPHCTGPPWPIATGAPVFPPTDWVMEALCLLKHLFFSLWFMDQSVAANYGQTTAQGTGIRCCLQSCFFFFN